MASRVSTQPGETLVAEAGTDTRAGFAAIYRAHFDDVHRWITYLGAPQRDAADLTQRVFEIVLARLDRFDGRNLMGWLYVISRKTVASYRRGAWVRRWLRSEKDTLDLFTVPSESAEQSLANKGAVEWALTRMSDKLRVAFILFEIEGRSVEEIASLMDLPHSTVYSRLRLARARFLALVAQLDEEGSR